MDLHSRGGGGCDGRSPGRGGGIPLASVGRGGGKLRAIGGVSNGLCGSALCQAYLVAEAVEELYPLTFVMVVGAPLHCLR